MKPPDVVKWYTRSALLYAVGAWTMVGALIYNTYGVQFDKEKYKVEEPDNPNRVVYKGDYYSSVVVYKENYVQPHTRIYNYFWGK